MKWVRIAKQGLERCQILRGAIGFTVKGKSCKNYQNYSTRTENMSKEYAAIMLNKPVAL